MKTKEACQRNKIERSIRKAFNIEDDSNALVNSIVSNLTWQIIKLEECKKNIDGKGIVSEFTQGDDTNYIQSVYVKTYKDLIKNYDITIKALLSILPKPDEKKKLSPEEQAFIKFATDKKSVIKRS